jgi:N-acetylneuraminic acid mutarotase
MFLHGQLREKEGAAPKPFSAPPGAHLVYFGGRIVSNIEVVQVIYGAGSYLPQITNTASPSVATFYQGVLNSAYVDWLTEYNTVGQPPPTSNQVLGRGSFRSQANITPSAPNNGTVIDDLQIQAEIQSQLASGMLPPPTHDAAGNNNTYYAIYFPHGKTITLGGAASCQVFCAYHGTIANAAGFGEIEYGVHPDFQPGSGCEFGCGAAATPFGNVTQVASHELIETMTDPEVGLATVFGPPLAWADFVFSEIGDICNDQNGHVVGSDGITYDVQTEFSNSLNDCIVTNPLATPMTITSAGEACRGTTAMATVTLQGGAGRFVNPVTLSVTGVSPTPPAGGEITATFDPNPVPTPPVNGSTSTMRISSTSMTPPGTYTVTVQAASTGLTTTSTTQVVIRSQAPTGPTLSSPADGADGVPQAATFTWQPADQASSYELDIFDGDGCQDKAVRTFTTNGTNFTIPNADALETFHQFSWNVTASNSCGGGPGATSACFNFRTASCSDPRELLVNGGFESGFGSWTIEQSVPAPVIDHTTVHTGTSSAALGTFTGISEPLGDSQISQTLTLSAGSTPMLSFWEWPLTTDSVTFDQQYVRVQPISPPGAVVVLMNEARNDQTYVHRTFDLSQFAGSTVKLIFGVHQDGFGDITGMFVDDISVVSQNCGPPDFSVSVSPTRSGEVCAGQSVSFNVAVDSVNGPNFTSSVTLSANNLPPGATATFADNPINPGQRTTLTVTTARPTTGSDFTITVSGTADKPPPDGARTASTPLLVDANAPNAPEIVSPLSGTVNVPRRPTLSWTAPFVPESPTNRSPTANPMGGLFPWQLAATAPPARIKPSSSTGSRSLSSSGSGPSNDLSVTPFQFGASAYHLQVARDANFSNIVVDTTVNSTSFTIGTDLDIATQYFWRVSAANACGASAFSATASFIVGACFEGWASGAAVPLTDGPSQSTVIGSAADNKVYVFGGGLGAGPNTRIDQVFSFDPLTNAWTPKASVPAPGLGANFGSGAQVGNSVYLFGGVVGPPQPITVTSTSWKYDIVGNTWSRIRDLPTANFGSAVAAIGGQVYLAYGSGFLQQTFRYDPASDTYTRVADAPAIPQTLRVHAAVVGGEMHVFAGGFEGNAHTVYNPATNTWRTAALMPFTATDPAVGVLAGKVFVVGGRPTAHTQVYDPATNTWSQASTVPGATGVDNTAGAVLGSTFHLVGGFNGTTSVNSHFQFHGCTLGALSSAAILPFVIDGNGTKPGIGNERSALVIDNSLSGTTMSVSCFLFGTNGAVLGSDTFTVAPNELKTVSDVVRALTHTSSVQNVTGSIAMFGTEVFSGMASVVNNASSDPVLLDGQPAGGSTSGYVSTVGSAGYFTQAVITNASPSTAVVQLLGYPAGGGTVPSGGTVVFIPGHGQASFTDVVNKMGLPSTFSGQLSWSSSQPVSVMARDIPRVGQTVSGVLPNHGGDASSSAVVAYVEDSATFSTALEISNPGPITANATVHFFETDSSGGPGVEHTRDLPVSANAGAPTADVVRWALHDTSSTPSGKHGFVVVTTPQSVTAQARMVDRGSADVTVPDGGAISSGFSPLLIRIEPFAPVPSPNAPAAGSTTVTRTALSNPGTTPVTVALTAFNANGTTAGTLSVTVGAHGQYLTENLAAAMGLPPIFLGWISVQSSGPVAIYNHRRSGNVGATVPVHAR